MRRKDKARNTPEFYTHVLTTATEVFVAFNSEGAPYVVPLNFAYDDGKLWIHCACEGRKLELLARDGRVGFSAVCGVEVLPETASTRYCSVCGTGQARFVTDPDERQHALRLLTLRYRANCALPIPEHKVAHTGVICIDITEISGKQSPALATPRQ